MVRLRRKRSRSCYVLYLGSAKNIVILRYMKRTLLRSILKRLVLAVTLFGSFCLAASLAAPPAAKAVITGLEKASVSPPVEATDGWVGSGQGGLLVSSGNASSLALNGKLDLAEGDGVWRQALFLSLLYGRNDGQISNERGEFRYQLDRQYTEKNYWFAGVDAVRDKFSGFDFRVTVSSGLGRRFIETSTTKLSANIGIGYEMFQEQVLLHDAMSNLISRVNGPTERALAGTFGLKAEHAISANTSLLETLAVITASGDTSIANDLSLRVNMGGRLALSVGHGIRANTRAPFGAKKLDQTTSVNVVYSLR